MKVADKISMNDADQNDEFNSIFPVLLYDMPHIKLIRDMINIHPVLLFLFYKLGTEEIKLDIVKSKISLYHQKKQWFDGLRHLKKLKLITFNASEIHRLQPENVYFKKKGDKVIDSWKESSLFKAFKWLEEKKSEVFISVDNYDQFFHKNFRAYETHENNVVFKESIPPFEEPQNITILSIECGFCKTIHKISIDTDHLEWYFNENRNYILKGIRCDRYALEFSFEINFNKLKFSMLVQYHDPNLKFPVDQQKHTSETSISFPQNNNIIVLKNIHRLRKKQNQRKSREQVTVKKIPNLLPSSKVKTQKTNQEEKLMQKTEEEKPKNDLIIEEKRQKSKESIQRVIREYQLRQQREAELRLRREQEEREKREINRWINKSNQIIYTCFEDETTEILSRGEYQLDREKIQSRVKKALKVFLEVLNPRQQVSFLKEFTLFWDDFFPKIFSEKQRLLEQRINSWEDKSKQIIDNSFKEIISNCLLQEKFQLDYEKEKIKIEGLGTEFCRSLDEVNQPFFRLKFKTISNDYFAMKFQEVQKQIYKEKERVEKEKLEQEEERLNQVIMEYIENFFQKMFYDIYAQAFLQNKMYLVEEETIDSLIESFKQRLESKYFPNKERYMDSFMISLQNRIKSFIDGIEKKLYEKSIKIKDEKRNPIRRDKKKSSNTLGTSAKN